MHQYNCGIRLVSVAFDCGRVLSITNPRVVDGGREGQSRRLWCQLRSSGGKDVGGGMFFGGRTDSCTGMFVDPELFLLKSCRCFRRAIG